MQARSRRRHPLPAPDGSNMEKDILSAIVEVENDIQERLVAEQQHAGAELCRLGQELADETRREEERMAAALEQAVAAAGIEARKRAAAIVHDAETEAMRLATLTDGALEEHIMGYLHRILPGGDK